jgi:hypothetical protein
MVESNPFAPGYHSFGSLSSGDLFGPGPSAWSFVRPWCVVLVDELAGRCDAALMERREDRARADGVYMALR